MTDVGSLDDYSALVYLVKGEVEVRGCWSWMVMVVDDVDVDVDDSLLVYSLCWVCKTASVDGRKEHCTLVLVIYKSAFGAYRTAGHGDH